MFPQSEHTPPYVTVGPYTSLLLGEALRAAIKLVARAGGGRYSGAVLLIGWRLQWVGEELCGDDEDGDDGDLDDGHDDHDDDDGHYGGRG